MPTPLLWRCLLLAAVHMFSVNGLLTDKASWAGPGEGGPRAASGAGSHVRDGEEPLTVHVVFGNHLDVGYTALDTDVINLYFTSHFPRAVHLAKQLRNLTEEGRQEGGQAYSPGDAFIYTTHSWLVSLYLECPPNMGLVCPTSAEKKEFEEAVRRGDVTWHAFPFNGQAEVYDEQMYEFALSMAHDLDDRFGLPRKVMMSQRDVPGLTRGAVPILSRNGVKALSVGVNWATAPPAVPHNMPFIWHDAQSGAQIVAMWHPNGYCGVANNVNVDSRSDCVTWPGFSHVLCVAWRNDNTGPPRSVFEVGKILMHVRDQFPGANVAASSFDAYGRALIDALPTLDLPVFIGEIGDTWVYGTGSDPLKHADFRAAMRARRACLQALECNMEDALLRNFSRLLLKVGEHTWGLAIQQLDDWASWSNADLAAALADPEGHPKWQLMLRSWQQQAAYIPFALEALGDPNHFIARQVRLDRQQRTAKARRPDFQQLATAEGGGYDVTTLVAEGERSGGRDGDYTDDDDDDGEDGSYRKAYGSASASSQVAVGSGGNGPSEARRSSTDRGGSTDSSSSSMDSSGSMDSIVERRTRSRRGLRTRARSSRRQLRGSRGSRSSGTRKDGTQGVAGAENLLAKDKPRTYPIETRYWIAEVDGRTGLLSTLRYKWPGDPDGRPHADDGRGDVRGPDALASSSSSSSSGSGGSSDSDNGGGSVRERRKTYYPANDWAGRGSELGRIMYSTYTEEDFKDMLTHHYSNVQPPWYSDFGKPNCSAGNPRKADLNAHLQSLRKLSGSNGVEIHAGFEFEGWASKLAGAPQEMWVNYTFPDDSPVLHMSVSWINKTPTRLPEALWVRFKPGHDAVEAASWAMDKLGTMISPLEVVRNGSFSLHAVQHGGITVRAAGSEDVAAWEMLRIRSLDAPLVSPGWPTVLPNPDVVPDLEEGAAFNLVNNVFGTNFVMWVPYTKEDVNLRFRFELEVFAEDRAMRRTVQTAAAAAAAVVTTRL